MKSVQNLALRRGSTTMKRINRLEDFLERPIEEAVKYDLSMEKASMNYCDATTIKKYGSSGMMVGEKHPQPQCLC